MKKIVITGGILALIGCSAVMISQNYGAKNATQMQQKIEKTEQEPLVFANKYGNYLAGRTASINGDHLSAAQFLGHIANLEKKKSPKMLRELAVRHYLMSGNVEKALELAKLYENKKGYELLQLIIELKKGDIKATRQSLQNLELGGLSSLFIPFVQSWLEFDETKKPSRVTVADALSHVQFRNLQYYHEALQLELNNEIAKAEVIYEKHTNELNKTPNAMIFSALRFFNANGNQDKALELLEKLRKLHQRDAFWHIKPSKQILAEIAACDYFKVNNVVEGVAESLANIGYLLASEGAKEEGQILLQLAIYLRPNHDLYKFILAESLEDEDKYSAAIKQYQQIKQPPFMADIVQISIARTLHSQGETEQARNILQKLATKLPVKYNIELMLGDLERIEGNDEASLAHYSAALELIGKSQEVNDWQLIFRRGVIYSSLGEWQKSEEDFEAALVLSPNEPDVLNYLAYGWLLRGINLEKAKKMLEVAVKAEPNNAQIIDSYGFALYQLGDYKKAFEVLEKSLELIPADPTVNDHYADVLWRLGRKGEAEFHWKRALVFKPTEKGAKEAIKIKLKNGLSDAKPN